MKKLTEHRLQDMSKIEVRYFTVPASKQYRDILVIRYIGAYPDGSAGNDDARYMRAMAKAGVEAFRGHFGVIHDLSELSYSWGDMLPSVFAVGPAIEPAPAAVVVGPKCEEAVRTVILGLKSPEPLEKIGYVFRNLDAAWAYVDARIK